VNATLDHAPGVNDPAVSVAWGKSGERGAVSLIASYEVRGELLGAQREPRSDTNFPASFPARALFNDSCAPVSLFARR